MYILNMDSNPSRDPDLKNPKLVIPANFFKNKL
jgi:hypothetical protein